MSHTDDITKTQKQALALATIIALVFGAYFLRKYFTLIVFAAILAFVFNPFYQYRLKRSGKPGPSAALTFIFASLVILIPMSLIVFVTGLQINHTIHELGSSLGSFDYGSAAQHIIDRINNILAKFPTSFRVTQDWLQTTAVDFLQKAGTTILNNLKGYVGGFFELFTTSIIFIFVFLSMLKNQKIIMETIRALNPLGGEISDIYTQKISAMTLAMVRGQFIIAVAQGFTDATLIYLGGLHQAYFFFFMIMTTLSFIPLGGGILAIPIGIVMMLTGNVTGGLIVIIGHLVIVTNIDNVLRPKLVPAEARLDSALTILSVFAGIALLGFLGIIVGPVIMIVIVTTIRVYLDVYHKTDKPLLTKNVT